MNKKLLWLIPFMLALLVLTSCEFLNKKTTEKAVPSKRKIASLNPYPNHSKNQIPVSNKVASAVVLVKDQKPICALSTTKAPHLVPEFLKVAPRRNTLDIKLPQCRQQEASMIKSTIGEAIVLDKHGGYKTAGPHVALAGACFGGAALSLAFTDTEWFQTKRDAKLVRGSGFFSGMVYTAGTILKSPHWSNVLKSFGITGICATGTTVALYIFEKDL